MTLQRFSLGVACGVFAWVLGAGDGLTAQTQGRKLDVSFNNGNVTIVAENVTLREIMAEWGRRGGSRIVNADRLGGAAIPFIEFKDEPEVVVLRSLLRDVPGYGAAPRIAPTADASSLEAVFILASRTVPVSGASAISSGAQPIQQPIEAVPQFEPPPQPAPRVIEGSPDMQLPPVRPVAGDLPPSTPGAPTSNNPNLRSGPGGTVTSTIPGVVIPGAPTTPTTPPTVPAGGRGRGGRGGGGGR